ncbi:MAG: ABC transporter permease subunit [Planctomycetota bacterium]|jgi:glutamate/aspartate transport system permease protein|nr:ABC transporter permease subunit [Planctomycetota bacterium]MDR1520138.1 ABC transporter permease subunit [Planctomycetota bacterium]
MIEIDWGMIWETAPLLWRGALLTLQITGVAVALGMLFGVVLAVAAVSPLPPLRWLAMSYINFFRVIPKVMILLWFYLVVPQVVANLLNLAPETDIRLISAITAFVIFESSFYAEIFRAGLNSVPRSQAKAALALGMTRSQVMLLVLLPQAFRNMIPVLLTHSIVIFQDSSLVYIIGLGDFFRTSANLGKNAGLYPGLVLFAGGMYFIACFLASQTVDYLKRRVALKKLRA